MKKRAANFTPEEKNELLDAVLRHRDVLFGRVGVPSRYWVAKKAAWCDIVDAVNKVRPSPGRNVHECRRKLKDLKAATRKKYMDVNGLWKNDVDIKEATPEEMKILKLLGNDEKEVEPDIKLKPSIVKTEDTVPVVVNSKSDATQAKPEMTNNKIPKLIIEAIAPSTVKSDDVAAITTTTTASVPPFPKASVLPPPPRASSVAASTPSTLRVEPSKRPIDDHTVRSTESTYTTPPVSCNQVSALSTMSTSSTYPSTSGHHVRVNVTPANNYHGNPGFHGNHSKQSNSGSQTNHDLHSSHINEGHALSAIQPVAFNLPSMSENNFNTTVTTMNVTPSDIQRNAQRKAARSFSHNHCRGVHRPYSEISSPPPMKRIKLFVRNVPTLSQPTTTVGPTSNGNVLNFAICSCHKHCRKAAMVDKGAQTDPQELNMLMLDKIIETQRMTARALIGLERIAQSLNCKVNNGNVNKTREDRKFALPVFIKEEKIDKDDGGNKENVNFGNVKVKSETEDKVE